MKRLIYSILLAQFFFVGYAAAQSVFNVHDSADINKTPVPISVHNERWWDDGGSMTDFSLRHAIRYGNNIWLSAYDAGNSLHLSAQTYTGIGVTFWPGPLTGSGATDHSTSEKWARIWKVNATDVQAFLATTPHTIANTPDAILTWPAKGNVNARGKDGAPLTITTKMAPFADLNGNGIYEPLQGEYPAFKGDQVLWWVFNDNGPARAAISGQTLSVEVHAMAYGYNRGTLIDRVMYFDYEIVNRSSGNYHDFRLAEWSGAGLGYPLDDYIGFDSSWRMAVLYNGTDDAGGGGHPANPIWNRPPVFGCTMIALPGDNAGSYVPAGSFDYYNNDASAIGNPVNDVECNNYMRAKLRDGQPFTNDFVGPHMQSVGFGSGPVSNYVFTGDPGDTTQWSECTCGNIPADRRFLLSSNDFSLNAGASEHIVAAYLLTDTGVGGCPNVSFAKIRELADTAWKIFRNPLPSLHDRIVCCSGSSEMIVYPNPAHDRLFIKGIRDAAIVVYNAVGQKIEMPVVKTADGYELNVIALPKGLYLLSCQRENGFDRVKFMKE